MPFEFKNCGTLMLLFLLLLFILIFILIILLLFILMNLEKTIYETQ